MSAAPCAGHRLLPGDRLEVVVHSEDNVVLHLGDAVIQLLDPEDTLAAIRTAIETGEDELSDVLDVLAMNERRERESDFRRAVGI